LVDTYVRSYDTLPVVQNYAHMDHHLSFPKIRSKSDKHTNKCHNSLMHAWWRWRGWPWFWGLTLDHVPNIWRPKDYGMGDNISTLWHVGMPPVWERRDLQRHIALPRHQQSHGLTMVHEQTAIAH